MKMAASGGQRVVPVMAPKRKLFTEGLYESGEYSDLTVRTKTHDFKVHKCIVCEQCPFLKGGSRGAWTEAQTGLINVEESAAVMDVVFRHLYKMELSFLPLKKDKKDDLLAKANPANFFLALGVPVAANKYLLDDLSTVGDLVLLNCISFGQVENLVDHAQALEERGQGQVGNLLGLAVMKLALNLRELLRLEEPWFTLHTNPHLQRLVIEASLSREGDGLCELFAERTGRPRSDFHAPASRCKWYTKT